MEGIKYVGERLDPVLGSLLEEGTNRDRWLACGRNINSSRIDSSTGYGTHGADIGCLEPKQQTSVCERIYDGESPTV